MSTPHQATHKSPRSLTSIPPAVGPTPIDLSSSLSSSLRAWLGARDVLIWQLVGGVGEEVIERVDGASVAEMVEQINKLRESAIGFAEQMATRRVTADAILADAAAKLLENEKPKFSLSLDDKAGSF